MGGVTQFDGIASNGIARINTDGTLDTSFVVGTGASGGPGAGYKIGVCALQSDAKIIIGGWFTDYNGTSINRIARLNSDGTLDTTFNVGTGANIGVVAAQIQNDGKILIGGAFTDYNGISRNSLARLNTNGTLDTSFNIGTGANDFIRTLTTQTDNKIIIGGEFTAYNGTAINSLARLNSDGGLDTTFDVGSGPGGANNLMETCVVQANGKILIGGGFPLYNGITNFCIARLNGGNAPCIALVSDSIYKDAAPFTWIAVPTYSSNIINARWDWGDGTDTIALYPSHTYSAAGNYNICVTAYASCGDSATTCNYDSIYRVNDGSAMVQINVIQNILTGSKPTGSYATPVLVYPNPASNIINITNIECSTIIHIYDTIGKLIIEKTIENNTTIDTGDLTQGVYVLVAENDKTKVFHKVMITR